MRDPSKLFHFDEKRCDHVRLFPDYDTAWAPYVATEMRSVMVAPMHI